MTLTEDRKCWANTLRRPTDPSQGSFPRDEAGCNWDNEGHPSGLCPDHRVEIIGEAA